MFLSSNTAQTSNFETGKISTGEAMTGKTFETWRRYIYDNCGIYFQDNKKYLLESRLQKRINYLNLSSFEEYYEFVNNPVKATHEKKYLYEAITINETFFFRNQPQFDAMINNIFPDLIQRKIAAKQKKIRIWSAASSSGEEAYTIAILIKDIVKPKYPDFEFEIIGTDINNNVIETAKKGHYKEYSVRQTPPYYLKKYFNRVDNVFVLNPEIVNMVSFKVMNLYDDFAMKMMFNFDLVMCANVLIYFDAESKIKVVSRLYDAMSAGGYLFIGYSETLHGISKAFKLISFPKTIGYKKE
jgi:chemotaxis protein methyltransferase CheR